MRTNSTRIMLLLGVAVTGIIASTPASAQNLDDIVVTARRVEERLQDVPISITVYNQEAISNRNIVVASDLAAYTPSLSVNQRFGPEKASFAIRGFQQENSTAPTVGVYFADVVGPRAQGGTTSGNSVGAGAFMDLQNVQVLKGPQGTLFGRNTTGGAILLVPQKPTGRLEGWIEGQLGNYDMKRVQAVLNVPVSDTFRVRASVDRNDREGYMKNHSGVGPEDYNDVNYFAARFSVVADLTPNLENYFIASYSNSFTHGYGGRVVACDRSYVLGDPAYNPAVALAAANIQKARYAPAACDQIDRQKARGDGPFDIEVGNPDPYIRLRQWQLINTTTWRASDSLTIKNIISYGEFRELSSFSSQGENFMGSARSPVTPASAVGQRFSTVLIKPRPGEDTAGESTFTEELQFQGNVGNNALIWQAGAYVERSLPLGWSSALIPQGGLGGCFTSEQVARLQCSTPLGTNVGNMSASSSKIAFSSTGFYGQATYRIVEGLNLTGGLRYTIDEINGQVETTRYNFTAAGIVTICNDAVNFPQPGTNPPTGKIVTDRSQCHREQKVRSEKPTWLINLDYKPSEDILLYAKWARGYRQGGLNFVNVNLETWGPEKVNSYEIGAKTGFRGTAIRGNFNIAGFYNSFTGQQVFYTLRANPASGLAGGAGIFNAGKSRLQGVEVDASATLFDRFRFDVGYTYLDTKLLSLNEPPLVYPYIAYNRRSNIGDALVYSPKHRLTLSGTYTVPLDESLGRLSFGATYTYTSGQNVDSSSIITAIGSSNLLNLNVNWNDVAGAPVDAGFFMTNVTNEAYEVGHVGAWSSNAFEAVLMGQPRMYGFRLRYKFGG